MMEDLMFVATKAKALELAGELESWYISGNEVPVERATIKADLAHEIARVLIILGSE